MRWTPLVALLPVLAANAPHPSAAELARARARRRRLSYFGKASEGCTTLLKEKKLDWLLEPFTCTHAVKTSPVALVLGTGLGDTGTRSVAKAVDALGVPTCHRSGATIKALEASNRRDMTPFASSGAWFDTPVASVWRRVACSFPNYKVVHTTRAGDRPRLSSTGNHMNARRRVPPRLLHADEQPRQEQVPRGDDGAPPRRALPRVRHDVPDARGRARRLRRRRGEPRPLRAAGQGPRHEHVDGLPPRPPRGVPRQARAARHAGRAAEHGVLLLRGAPGDGGEPRGRCSAWRARPAQRWSPSAW